MIEKRSHRFLDKPDNLPALAVAKPKDARLTKLRLEALDDGSAKPGVVGKQLDPGELAVVIDIELVHDLPHVRNDLFSRHCLVDGGKMLNQLLLVEPAVLVHVGEEELVGFFWRHAARGLALLGQLGERFLKNVSCFLKIGLGRHLVVKRLAANTEDVAKLDGLVPNALAAHEVD